MKQKSEIKRTGPELLKRLLRQREMSVFLIILLVVAIVAIVNPKFIQPSNMKSIALSVATDGLLSIGLTLALILGGIELSVGGVAAMTCVIAGQMALMGVNIWVACLAALAAGRQNSGRGAGYWLSLSGCGKILCMYPAYGER